MSFRVQDAMTVDVSDATVVTLYLLAASNVKLRPILTRTLRPGARIVAHNYPIGTGSPTSWTRSPTPPAPRERCSCGR